MKSKFLENNEGRSVHNKVFYDFDLKCFYIFYSYVKYIKLRTEKMIRKLGKRKERIIIVRSIHKKRDRADFNKYLLLDVT